MNPNNYMTLEHFNTLNEVEQHEAVWSGVCMGYREEGEYKIVIYQVSDFYAEVYYHEENNELKKLMAIPTLTKESIPNINPSTLYE